MLDDYSTKQSFKKFVSLLYSLLMKTFLKRLVSGIAIGIGAAVPGISGGTIAIILDVYESIISAVSNIFKKFKESIIVLIPILIGVIAAIIPCIILFDKLFEGMLFIMICIFAGLMIGSMPKVFDEVKGTKITKNGIFAFIICLLIALGIGIGSVFLGGKINLDSHFASPEWWFYLVMIPVGIIGSFALVIPGISGSMLLLILGFYSPLINVVSDLFKGKSTNPGSVIGLVACFAVGVVIGFYLTSKVMKYLLNRYKLTTMWGIIGFIIGSIAVLFFNSTIYAYYQKMAGNIPVGGVIPWMPWYVEVPVGIVLLILFAALAYFSIRYFKKKLETK